MKAIVFTKYGPPSVLRLEEVPKPSPGPKEVLVRIVATAVNDYDWSMIRGKPFLYRLMFGLFKPRMTIPGMELAGMVEEVGKEVTDFKVGDEVYGDTSDADFGTYAEFITVESKALVRKPEHMSFEVAASIPHASMLAYQGLYDIADIKEGEKVLINGAGGGMGTFGLQLAKLHKAEVTGVDTGEKLQMMEDLGFDHIIDYKKEDFTRNSIKYDLVLDAKTTRPPGAYKKSLSEKGRYVTVGGGLWRLFRIYLSGKLFNKNNDKTLHVLGLKTNKDLEEINKLFGEGKLKSIIDGPYPLHKAAWAVQYFGEGKHSGKVVLSIAEK